MISDEDKKEIFDQYRIGYGYAKEQLMRWYKISEAEAEDLMKQGQKIKAAVFGSDE
jgi:hypothetical protein